MERAIWHSQLYVNSFAISLFARSVANIFMLCVLGKHKVLNIEVTIIWAKTYKGPDALRYLKL